MFTTTEQSTKVDRNVAKSQLKLRHEPTFRNLGLTNPYFTIKLAYTPQNRHEKMISMFENELAYGNDIYIELVDRSNKPIYNHPVLYRLNYNPYFKSEYEFAKKDEKRTYDSYLVPLADLILVAGNPGLEEETSRKTDTGTKFVPIESYDREQPDCHTNELTARDWACIHLKVPSSNKKWLNEIIIKAK